MNPPAFPPQQRSADDEHLKLLVIFHYVMAGLGVLGLLFLIGHGAMMSTVFAYMGAEKGPDAPPPEMQRMFPIFVSIFYGVMGLAIIAGSILNFLSARWMKERRNRMFSLIVAGLNCLQIPLGLALGIFTFIVLCRPSVVEAYAARAA